MTPPHYADDTVTLHHGDCIDVLRALPDNSVDSIVTDPPYSLSFMGRKWDTHASPRAFQEWCESWARECLRVVKPGGHILSFGGSRTYHRLAVAIEDAGFEIRDSIAWLYGSGFPKSLDVGKAIDKAAGAEREVIGTSPFASRRPNGYTGTLRLDGFTTVTELERAAAAGEKTPNGRDAATTLARYHSRTLAGNGETAPATPDAQQWDGWGTALKPAFEPVVVGRKPLVGTVAGNVTVWGTGALNINACRIATDEPLASHHATNGAAGVTFGTRREYVPGSASPENTHTKGRWPANVVLDEGQAATLDQQSGTIHARGNTSPEKCGTSTGVTGWGAGRPDAPPNPGDKGGASRFFYCAKAPKSERPVVDGTAHPTVKPLTLMRWLVRLVTPPGGTVLEPFAGSGTTVEACIVEGFRCVAIERDPDYLPLILARIERAHATVEASAATAGDLLDLDFGT